MMFLEGIKLTKQFESLVALKNVSFHIREGEIVGLIGPNGSGKTTLFNLISGVLPPTLGTLRFKGEDITGLKPYEICRKGISRTFQLVRPFLNHTVLENVLVGIFFSRRHTSDMEASRIEAMRLLDVVGLSEKRDQVASELTLLQQKRVEIARALATRPELLLLDEPAAGFNPLETAEMIDLLRCINTKMGITMCIVEHVMTAIMNLSDRIIVLHYGEKIAEGVPGEVARDKKVMQVYLGERFAAA